MHFLVIINLWHPAWHCIHAIYWHTFTVTGTVSISATTQIQSITPTQTAAPTDSLTRMPTTTFTFSTNEVDRSTSISPITASPTSGIVILTTVSPSLVLTTSEPSVMIITSLVSQSDSGGRSSIATIPSTTGPNRSRDTGLIVGMVFLFLILLIAASIVIVLLVIIILRKKKEKKIKSKSWHII